jgi:O-antigen/teichoic acid export membrane protein
VTAGPPPPPPSTLAGQLRALLGQSLVYGTADVFGRALNFLFLPVYLSLLTPADMGTLGLLFLFSSLAKIVVRLGLDAGFFRVHYDLEDAGQRRRLAGTALVFSVLVAGVFMGLVALAAGPLTHFLLGRAAPRTWVLLAAADVSVGALLFVPLNLLRIEDRARLFTGLSIFRHSANAVLKALLLVKGWGVSGPLWSDVLSTAALAAVLLPLLWRRARPALDGALLRAMLGFGLPKVPHGLMVQVQNLADRKILDLFVSRATVGIYQVGYSLAEAVKFPLSAFETAWGPFVYSRLKQPDAPRTLARVATHAFAAFVFVGLGVALFARELLVVMSPRHSEWRAAAVVVPVVVLAYLFHGLFLLTSIGIGIAKAARRYPLVTAVAALVNVAANFALIPRFGMLGAAWATVLSYAVMAGVGYGLARALYPIRYEGGRMLRVALSGAAAFALGRLAPDALLPALAVKTGALLAFPALLAAGGFWRGLSVPRP